MNKEGKYLIIPLVVSLIIIITLSFTIISLDNDVQGYKSAYEHNKSEAEKMEIKINELNEDLTLYKAVVRQNKFKDSFLQALVNTTFNYETGYGTSTMWLEQNNPGGIKGWYSGEYLVYESQIHGLTHLESLLRDKYINTYGYDVIAIRKAYDPNYTEEQLQEFVRMFKLELERLLNGSDTL